MSFFILKIGEPALPKELSRRTLRTNSVGLDSYPPDEPRPAKVQSETAGSRAQHTNITWGIQLKHMCAAYEGGRMHSDK